MFSYARRKSLMMGWQSTGSYLKFLSSDHISRCLRQCPLLNVHGQSTLGSIPYPMLTAPQRIFRQQVLTSPTENGHFHLVEHHNMTGISSIHIEADLLNSSTEPLDRKLNCITTLEITKLQSLLHNTLVDPALLENLLCIQIHQQPASKVLLIADMFCVSSEYNARQYMKTMFYYFLNNWDTLIINASEITQLSFYIAVFRKAPIELLSNMENFISSNVDKFSANELALICHAFFVTNTSLRDFKLLRKIMLVVLRDIREGTFHINLIANIVKSMRHASFDFVSDFNELALVLSDCGRITKCSTNQLMHVACAFSSVRISNQELFSLILSEFSRHMDRTKSRYRYRLKDLGRIIGAFSVVGQSVPEFMASALIDGMRADPSYHHQYPVMFVENLATLAILGYYPQDLINIALSKIQKAQPLKQGFQTVLLDTAVHIECPSYSGERLHKDVVERHCHRPECSLSLQMVTRQGLSSMLAALSSLIGIDYITVRNILPYSNIADVVLVLDKQNNLVCSEQTTRQRTEWLDHLPLTSNAKQPQPRSILKEIMMEKFGSTNTLKRSDPGDVFVKSCKPDIDMRKLVLRVTGWRQYLLNEPTQTAYHKMEIKLLSQLGYDCYIMSPEKAADFDSMNDEDRGRYVADVLKRCNVSV